MKRITLLICSFSIFLDLNAQWQNGTDIYNTNSGNVGIGIQFPVGKLSVNLSNTNYTNTNGAGSHIMLSNPSTTGQNVLSSYINNTLVAKWRTDFEGNINWIAANGYHAFYTGGDFPTGTVKMFISNGGNVGIGTTSPSSLLHVNGDITAGPSGGGYHLIINDIPTARWALGTGGFGLHIANDYTSTWTDRVFINQDGNVGIGTTNPQSKLTINGDGISLTNNGNTVWLNGNVTNGSTTSGLQIAANTGTSNGASIMLWNFASGYTYKNGSVDLCSYGTTGHGIRFTNYNTSTNTWNDNMVLTKDGKLIIGNPDFIPTPGNYKLYVQDGIITEKVRVALKTTTDWADYVFDNDYKSMPLPELEQYLKSYRHLPNLPPADQVVKEGIDLAKMDAKLLENIEELTLYIIQLNKENQDLKKQINSLTQNTSNINDFDKKLKDLEGQIVELKNALLEVKK